MDQAPQSRLKELITKGKEQGYLTFAEVNDHLPQDIIDSDQVEDIIRMINDMGIQVFENAPDNDTLMMSEANTDMLLKLQHKHLLPLKVKSVVLQTLCVCICVKWVP